MISRKLLGIDCDGTLTKETCFTIEEVLKAEPRLDIIEKVNHLYDHNFIIIYTARRDNLTEATKSWLRENGVKYHAYSNFKIPLDDLIDDHVTHVDDIDTLM